MSEKKPTPSDISMRLYREKVPAKLKWNKNRVKGGGWWSLIFGPKEDIAMPGSLDTGSLSDTNATIDAYVEERKKAGRG